MIAILDFDSGRPQSVKDAFEKLGAGAKIVNSIDGLERAQKVVLPTGDSFHRTIRSLRDRGFVPPLLRVIDRGQPTLGIGLGLHVLFDVSYEEGQHTGLGVIHGKVTGFQHSGLGAVNSSIPHRGMSPVHWEKDCPLLAGLVSGTPFYFDHAYFAEPLDARLIAATCNPGVEFPAVIWRGSIFATQFHPEGSNDAGLAVLDNFVKM